MQSCVLSQQFQVNMINKIMETVSRRSRHIKINSEFKHNKHLEKTDNVVLFTNS